MSRDVHTVLMRWLQTAEDEVSYTPDAEAEVPPCAWCALPLAAFVETPLLPGTQHGVICRVCHRLSVREPDGSVRQGRPEELPADVYLFCCEELEA